MKHTHRWAKVLSSSSKSLLLLCILLPVFAYAQPAVIKSMRIRPAADNSRFIFTLTQKVPVKLSYHSRPHRLVAEFSNVTRRFAMRNSRLGGANVKTVNSVDGQNNTITFTFTTEVKPTWKGQYLKSKKDADVEYELSVTTPKVNMLKAAFASPASIRHELLQSIAKATKKISKVTKVDRKLVIVIDPGHGGRDSGALGKAGIKEKAIALNVAKQLARNINKTKRMRAVLTRSGDYYVSLRKRLQVARKHHADLYVSIHADAYLHGRASGASVYALSPQGATSEAARWLAQQENHSELGKVELDELSDQSKMLRSIMIDLAQTATIRDSLHLGREMVNALDDFSKMHRSRVEQAPFVVLKSPDIPSVLVETGFITNPVEEKRLNSAAYQKQLADALYTGINTYFQSRYYLTMSHAKDLNTAKA